MSWSGRSFVRSIDWSGIKHWSVRFGGKISAGVWHNRFGFKKCYNSFATCRSMCVSFHSIFLIACFVFIEFHMISHNVLVCSRARLLVCDSHLALASCSTIIRWRIWCKLYYYYLVLLLGLRIQHTHTHTQRMDDSVYHVLVCEWSRAFFSHSEHISWI